MTISNDLKLVAFDLDGTLLDSASSIISGVTECWAACGFARPEPDAIRRIIGLPWRSLLRAFCLRPGILKCKK